jgi:hypothetical protein
MGVSISGPFSLGVSHLKNGSDRPYQIYWKIFCSPCKFSYSLLACCSPFFEKQNVKFSDDGTNVIEGEDVD